MKCALRILRDLRGLTLDIFLEGLLAIYIVYVLDLICFAYIVLLCQLYFAPLAL